jgi:hypothetical protein
MTTLVVLSAFALTRTNKSTIGPAAAVVACKRKRQHTRETRIDRRVRLFIVGSSKTFEWDLPMVAWLFPVKLCATINP